MDKKSAKNTIQMLAKELEDYNYQYYVLNEPVVSDKEFDDKLKKLIELEEDFPDLKRNDSPTQRVGTKIPSTAKTVKHKVKMYSLDNTYSIDELKEWEARVEKGLGQKRNEYVVELKIDGVSAALTYKSGEFVLGATRGDGIEGEDVTHSFKTIHSIPLTIRDTKFGIPKTLDIRGEIYMRLEDFRKMNQERKRQDEPLFANPRNATSGSVKLLDSRITAKRNLQCAIHSFGKIEGTKEIKTQWEFLSKAKDLGFAVDPRIKLCRSFKEVIDYCRHWQAKRESIPYEVDGVVIKVNSLAQQKKLGATLKSPRWAVAYKFPAHQATTEIEDISFQVGRTGVITPVAELKPIECAGVTISRSTLHNFDEIKRLGVRKGDRVVVERAGDVIPKIVKVVKKGKGKAVTVPKKCPAKGCHGQVVRESTDAVSYRCINPSCPKQLERGLLHFASRSAMDIEGLGESVVIQLIDNGLIRDFADIYSIKEKDLLALELFKEKKARNLLNAIEKSKTQPLARLLFGLGINNIGEKAALTLAQTFAKIENLSKAKQADFKNIYEIGEIMAASVEQFFKQTSTKQLLNKFKKVGVNTIQPKATVTLSKLSGMKFVFTGELDNLSRQEASKRVKVLGGSVSSSVSKKTDYVVIGSNPGSKYKKAQDLGVKILSQGAFEKFLINS